MTAGITRARLLAAAGAIAGGGALATLFTPGETERPRGQGLPAGQHAWDAVLVRDQHGNAVAPRFHSLAMLRVATGAGPAEARRLEQALRVLEAAFAYGPGGLLTALGWSHSYFEDVLGTASPVPGATPLSPIEDPALERHHACLHLACDDEQRLSRIERALFRGAPLDEAPGASLDLAGVLELVEVRRGFVGTGLPRAHRGVVGIPADAPVPAESPLFMGFRSGFARNQAPEERVTIDEGPFAGGTTMHVSRIELSLDDWYGVLDEQERVARMFAPQVSVADVGRFTDDAPSHPDQLDEAARRYGVVGHAQAAATARETERPVIIRRDFDSVDGGRSLVHFVAVQRSIDDFVRTRKAMNAARASTLNPSVGPQINNGINEWMNVTARANFVVPPRHLRSFPSMPGAESRA